jgi:hypothetical protein
MPLAHRAELAEQARDLVVRGVAADAVHADAQFLRVLQRGAGREARAQRLADEIHQLRGELVATRAAALAGSALLADLPAPLADPLARAGAHEAPGHHDRRTVTRRGAGERGLVEIPDLLGADGLL